MLFLLFRSTYKLFFRRSTQPPAKPTLPSGSELASLVHRSFMNVDMDNDTFIEYYEFDTLIIVADKDSE